MIGRKYKKTYQLAQKVKVKVLKVDILKNQIDLELVKEGETETDAEKTIKNLISKGHNLVVEDEWSLGRMTAATKDGNILKAAANPRFMQGYAIGR